MESKLMHTVKRMSAGSQSAVDRWKAGRFSVGKQYGDSTHDTHSQKIQHPSLLRTQSDDHGEQHRQDQ